MAAKSRKLSDVFGAPEPPGEHTLVQVVWEKPTAKVKLTLHGDVNCPLLELNGHKTHVEQTDVGNLHGKARKKLYPTWIRFAKTNDGPVDNVCSRCIPKSDVRGIIQTLVIDQETRELKREDGARLRLERYVQLLVELRVENQKGNDRDVDAWIIWISGQTPEQLLETGRTMVGWTGPMVAMFGKPRGLYCVGDGAGRGRGYPWTHVLGTYVTSSGGTRLYCILPEHLVPQDQAHERSTPVVKVDEQFDENHLKLAVALYETLNDEEDLDELAAWVDSWLKEHEEYTRTDTFNARTRMQAEEAVETAIMCLRPTENDKR